MASRGRPSKKELAYIKEMAPQCISEEDIETTICAGLKKKFKVDRTPELVRSIMEKNNLLVVPITNREDNKELLTQLRSSSIWYAAREECSDRELERFESEWISYMKQFNEDVLATEQKDLYHLIMTDVYISRMGKEERNHLDRLEESGKELEQLYKLPPEDRDIDEIKRLQHITETLSGSMSKFALDKTKYMTQRKDLMRSLKGARSDRVKRVESGNETWQGYLRMMENKKIRQDEGEEIEKMKLAADKLEQSLSMKPIEYLDRQADYPILLPEAVQKRRENESTDTE